MLFTRLFAAAAVVATVVAQSTKIQFTTLPSNVQVGKPVSIKWTGGDGSPVTITLKKGDAKDLKTVSVLTGGVSGDSYTWTPSEDLASGDDYALQITQGVSEINYTGEFSIGGGSASSSGSSSSSDSASATSTATVTVKSSGITTSTSTVYASSGTGTVTVARNTTMVSPTLSRTGGGLSAGTQAPTQTSSGVAAASSSGVASNLQAQFVMGIGALAAAAFAL